MESNSSEDPPTNPRSLTAAQRERKRKVDKMKQRTKRAENKARLEDIERDVTFLREAVGELLGHFREARQLQPASHGDRGSMTGRIINADAEGEIDFEARSARSGRSGGSMSGTQSIPPRYDDSIVPYVPGQYRLPPHQAWTGNGRCATRCGCCGAPYNHNTNPNHVNNEFAGNLSANVRVQPYANAPYQPPPLSPPRIAPGANSSLRIVVDCRCGHAHDYQTQCIEYTGFSLLLGPGRPQGPARTKLPRSPLLPEILLHSVSGENPLSAAIAVVIRPFKVLSLATHVGWFFLAYRLLRWRLNPTPENFNDVPPNMRPTPSQERLPHPFSRDFLPWPALREHMNAIQHADRRSTVQMFLESVVFDWPTGKDLMCRNERGEWDLHPDFEVTVGDARCWHLEGPYAREFPELIPYAH